MQMLQQDSFLDYKLVCRKCCLMFYKMEEMRMDMVLDFILPANHRPATSLTNVIMGNADSVLPEGLQRFPLFSFDAIVIVSARYSSIGQPRVEFFTSFVSCPSHYLSFVIRLHGQVNSGIDRKGWLEGQCRIEMIKNAEVSYRMVVTYRISTNLNFSDTW